MTEEKDAPEPERIPTPEGKVIVNTSTSEKVQEILTQSKTSESAARNEPSAPESKAPELIKTPEPQEKSAVVVQTKLEAPEASKILVEPELTKTPEPAEIPPKEVGQTKLEPAIEAAKTPEPSETPPKAAGEPPTVKTKPEPVVEEAKTSEAAAEIPAGEPPTVKAVTTTTGPVEIPPKAIVTPEPHEKSSVIVQKAIPEPTKTREPVEIPLKALEAADIPAKAAGEPPTVKAVTKTTPGPVEIPLKEIVTPEPHEKSPEIVQKAIPEPTKTPEPAEIPPKAIVTPEPDEKSSVVVQKKLKAPEAVEIPAKAAGEPPTVKEIPEPTKTREPVEIPLKAIVTPEPQETLKALEAADIPAKADGEPPAAKAVLETREPAEIPPKAIVTPEPEETLEKTSVVVQRKLDPAIEKAKTPEPPKAVEPVIIPAKPVNTSEEILNRLESAVEPVILPAKPVNTPKSEKVEEILSEAKNRSAIEPLEVKVASKPVIKPKQRPPVPARPAKRSTAAAEKPSEPQLGLQQLRKKRQDEWNIKQQRREQDQSRNIAAPPPKLSPRQHEGRITRPYVAPERQTERERYTTPRKPRDDDETSVDSLEDGQPPAQDLNTEPKSEIHIPSDGLEKDSLHGRDLNTEPKKESKSEIHIPSDDLQEEEKDSLHGRQPPKSSPRESEKSEIDIPSDDLQVEEKVFLYEQPLANLSPRESEIDFDQATEDDLIKPTGLVVEKSETKKKKSDDLGKEEKPRTKVPRIGKKPSKQVTEMKKSSFKAREQTKTRRQKPKEKAFDLEERGRDLDEKTLKPRKKKIDLEERGKDLDDTTRQKAAEVKSQKAVETTIKLDVGGKIFECDRKLLLKHPKGRLYDLSKSVESSPSVFLDRNPVYFEPILDFYRTDKMFLAKDLNPEAIEEEAKYFRIHSLMFPPVKKLPPPAETFYFAKRIIQKMESSSVPVTFLLRQHEQLIVETAKGLGRVLLKVVEDSGSIQVAEAVIFDSNSYFFLNGGRAKLQHTPLPGNFSYTFWVETPAPDQMIEIEFKLIYTFQGSERMDEAPDPIVLPDTIRNDPSNIVVTSPKKAAPDPNPRYEYKEIGRPPSNGYYPNYNSEMSNGYYAPSQHSNYTTTGNYNSERPTGNYNFAKPATGFFPAIVKPAPNEQASSSYYAPRPDKSATYLPQLKQQEHGNYQAPQISTSRARNTPIQMRQPRSFGR